ncbi:hypothetical protein U1Q18_010490, partial [Sarracenia purpurea var. burkii]
MGGGSQRWWMAGEDGDLRWRRRAATCDGGGWAEVRDLRGRQFVKETNRSAVDVDGG